MKKQRLIDVDELLLKQRFMIAAPWSEDHDGYAVPVEEIYNASTIKARPVVHGKWELYGNDDDLGCSYFCSKCGANYDEDYFYERQQFIPFNYCPNCGADMQERE